MPHSFGLVLNRSKDLRKLLYAYVMQIFIYSYTHTHIYIYIYTILWIFFLQSLNVPLKEFICYKKSDKKCVAGVVSTFAK